jgi:hypothetical protein
VKRFVTLASTISILLCLSDAWLWYRSHRVCESFYVQRAGYAVVVEVCAGSVNIAWHRHHGPAEQIRHSKYTAFPDDLGPPGWFRRNIISSHEGPIWTNIFLGASSFLIPSTIVHLRMQALCVAFLILPIISLSRFVWRRRPDVGFVV